MYYLVTFLDRTPVFECFVFRYGSKNIYHKDIS